ncbi:NifB/NifX family molybdenum-iron cluster-binding protein [Niameybacter massiliensis]|uniref:NifB/NifX family molybdenum-iron cluster-binding protein n=1 Tax=Holtiella tumoricola TaxID=3018743 RepID=A0AA42J471_9FIRM|nr:MULTISPECIES: NifB/NifX family molybdenum-iron cluster-binding protein [Lachnospirales]MDA3734056.1 NifB/NifX family molybdenum-iron cluster-binding protein [Holtiella tumoricola]
MKIVVPVNEDKKTICVSFGRTPSFLFIDTATNHKEYVENEAVNAPGGAGIQAAQFIVDTGADILLTPRCGENAAKVLQAANVKMYQTTTEQVDEEIDKFTEGKLEPLSKIHAGFHNHGFDK